MIARINILSDETEIVFENIQGSTVGSTAAGGMGLGDTEEVGGAQERHLQDGHTGFLKPTKLKKKKNVENISSSALLSGPPRVEATIKVPSASTKVNFF